MNSAENLCRRIIEDAKAYIENKQLDTNAEIDSIIQTAKSKARTVEQEAAEEMKRRENAYNERESAVSQKAVRNAVLIEKSRVLEGIVNDAKKALCALDGDAYVTFIHNLFSSCKSTNKPAVYLQKNRESLKEQLEKKLGDVSIFFVPEIEGGALIREQDIDFDCRIDTVLARFRAEHEPKLQELLFGDGQ